MKASEITIKQLDVSRRTKNILLRFLQNNGKVPSEDYFVSVFTGVEFSEILAMPGSGDKTISELKHEFNKLEW